VSAPLRGVSVRDALDSALVPLRAAKVDSPRLDAELLLADAMGIDRAQLAMHPERELDGAATRRFQTTMRRRVFDREPIAYILGRKGFRNIELGVDRRVLIPRPETEHLVEAALGLPDGASVVDVGTGSGAVALALKDERPDLRVTATDIDDGALAVARANAERLGLEVDFAVADLLPAGASFDAVVSNPPYVGETGMDGLAPEIARHEPQLALYGGGSLGLDLIGRLVERVESPFVALEVGEGQSETVAAGLAAKGYVTEIVPDLAGIERVVVGRR
jgi:release factor glutamine methyltransferase